VLSAAIGLAPLVALVSYTADRGLAGLSIGFLTHAPVPVGIPGGGISTAIVGSAEIVGLALVMAIPVGLMAALFLHERRGHLAGAIRFGADLLTGVPSIVIGIFAYALLVRPLHHFSDLAAAFALAVLMLPIMIRADEEAMRTVAIDLWEAGVALGARRSRVARSVVLRGALPGLVTGNLLAVSRGVGETAPLLFTVAAPSFAMTLLIYTEGTEPFPAAQQTAWSTALVLLLFVLVLSGVARLVAWHLTRRAR
jgi:phosphate transport system permease protein